MKTTSSLFAGCVVCQVLGAAGAAVAQALSVHPCSPGHTTLRRGERVAHPRDKLLKSWHMGMGRVGQAQVALQGCPHFLG